MTRLAYLKRIALSQHSIQRLFRMEAALFTSLFDNGVTTRHGMCEELAPEGINRTQNQNYFMAEGHRRLDPKFYAAFLRHQAQAERFFRRAVEEFNRLKSLRAELAHDLPEDLTNEPIPAPQPAQTEPLPAPPHEPEAEPANQPPSPPEQPAPIPAACPDHDPQPPGTHMLN